LFFSSGDHTNSNIPLPTGRIFPCANSSSHTARGYSRGGVMAVTFDLVADIGDRPSLES